ALVLSVSLGVVLGLLAAVKRNSPIDRLVMLFSLGGVSIPSFFFAILLILLFSVTLGLVPATGSGSLDRLILPALVLGYEGTGLIARLTRASLLDVLGREYVRTAHAKGLAPRSVLLGHAMRNALIPVVTIVGLQLGRPLAGRMGMVMLACLALLVAAVIVLPVAIAIDPFKQSLKDSLLAPGTQGHPLGTDQFGRDVLLRLIDGGRASLSIGFAAVAIAMVSGGLVGLVAGMRGGWVDRALMRLVDVELAFPGILLALIIVTILGPGLEKVAIAVGVGGMPRFARIVRCSVLSTE